MKYKKWISENYPDMRSALAKCKDACQKMAKEFPELKITNGFAHFISCDPREHWWCVDSKGNIVDPTAHQFPEYLGSPIIRYEEIDDNHDARKFPKARCMNCGEYYYAKPEMNGQMHNSKCEREFDIYLNGDKDES